MNIKDTLIEEFWNKKIIAHEIRDSRFPAFVKLNAGIEKKDFNDSKFLLDKSLIKRIDQVCNNSDFLIYSFLLSAFKILKYKYCGNETISIATSNLQFKSVKVKEHIPDENSILLIKAYIKDHETFKDVFSNVKTNVTDVYLNQSIVSKRILFDTCQVAAKDPFDLFDSFCIDGINRENSEFEKFNLQFYIRNLHDGPFLQIYYNKTIYTREIIKLLASNFSFLLTSLLENLYIPISAISILSTEEYTTVQKFNSKSFSFEKDKMFIDHFEEQVKKTPDAIAVSNTFSQLTYTELNSRANQLAAALREQGLSREDLVCLFCERSVEMLIGILGTFKAGGAYLPIEIDWPSNRVLTILQDSKTRFLITTSKTLVVEDSYFLNQLCQKSNVNKVIYIDEKKNIQYLNNIFRTLSFSRDLAQQENYRWNSESLNKDTSYLFWDSKEISWKEIEQKKDLFCDYLKNTGIAGSKPSLAVLTDNPVYRTIITLTLQELGIRPYIVNPLLDSTNIKLTLIHSQSKIIISERKYLKDIDQLLWEKKLDALILIDRNSEKSDDKENTFKTVWNFIAENSSEKINDYGWVNSYSGEPFSEEEMQEYINNFCQKLDPFITPQTKIMEIGCGHGLVLSNIARKVSYYLATDLSNIIIDKNKLLVKNMQLDNIVELVPLGAKDIFKAKHKGPFDVIICSSVIHYFPDILYLEKVLTDAIEMLTDEGLIYLDDIIDLEKKEEFMNSLKSSKAKTNWNDPLLVDKHFFQELKQKYPEIVSLEYSRKLGQIENELTKYRYDILLKINKKRRSLKKNGTPEKKYYTDFHMDDVLKPFGRDESNKKEVPGFASTKTAIWDLKYIKKFSETNKRYTSQPSDLSYVIYTSGSTGTPKGVMIEQLGMLNHLYAKINDLNLNEKSVIAQNASHCFDISVWQFLAALIVGGKTIIYSKDLIVNVNEFVRLLKKDEVTILEIVPSYLAIMMEAVNEIKNEHSFRSLLYLMVTGEAVPPSLVKKWLTQHRDIPLVNAYGPTEASDDITHHIIKKVPSTDTISIGSPIQNMKINIVDSNMHVCPIGVKGEITVSGIGVGRGYLNNPEKTKEVFINDPFETGENRLYKTGDIGRWLPNGSIEFYGRKDDQVKISGYRIELGDIEQHMIKSTGIKNAIVIDKTDEKGNKYLCAYILSEDGSKVDISDLKGFLSKQLPEYMIPGHFIQMNKFPLTNNGKIDKNTLPDPFANSTKSYVSANTEIEKELVKLWEELLEVNPIGINDSFFELGGHSLRAIKLISQIYKKYQVELSLRDIFNSTTIKSLSALLEHKAKSYHFAIKPIPRQEYYDLSHAQKRLWIIDQLEEGKSIAYNIPLACEIKGNVDVTVLNQVFNILIDRHEILRTNIILVDEEPKQKILPTIHFSIEQIDLRERQDQQELVKSYFEKESKSAFNLATAPLLRAKLLQLEEQRYFFLFTMHHIISDGWSMTIFLDEAVRLYDTLIKGGENPLTELTIQYKDYAVWHNKILSDPEMNKSRMYWHAKLAGELPILDLPTDYTRPAIKSNNGETIKRFIEKKDALSLLKTSQEKETSIYIFLLSIFKILLYRYTAQEDIIVGTPAAGRLYGELEEQLGFYVNTLVLRDKIKPEDRFIDVLEKVGQTVLDAFEHQTYPFDKLIDDLNVDRDLSRNPLIQVLFSLDNESDEQEIRFGNSILSLSPFNHVVSKFDLTFNISEGKNGFELSMLYNTDLFQKETMERMADHYLNILKEVVVNSYEKISNINIHTDMEIDQLLVKFNCSKIDYPKHKTVVELFEEQVMHSKNKRAVVFEDSHLSYSQLNFRSNQIANYLCKQGIGVGSLVAICIDTSIEMIISMIGILKTGAAYVPIDPDHPENKIDYILKDTGTQVILVNKKNEAIFQRIYNGKIVLVDIPQPDIEKESTQNPETLFKSSDLAYVIYTSGTTGISKGVCISHLNIMDYYSGLFSKSFIQNCTSYGLMSTAAADLGNTVLYGALLSGGALHLFSRDSLTNAKKILHYFKNNTIDCIKIVPSHWKALSDNDDMLLPERLLIFGGEELSVDIVDKISAKKNYCKIVNHYGPTETTIGKLLYEVDIRIKKRAIPIGKPFSNSKVYVLSDTLHLQPIGVAGELFISGDGVSAGYLNNERLTEERFIPNPYEKTGKLYKTGDLVRWLTDGNVEFLGRKDNQVKIRGYRIELEEVEDTLMQIPYIKQCKVIAKELSTGTKDLIAYIISEAKLNVSNLKADLIGKLANYMLPSYFIQVDAIPLTTNGKVDIRALSNHFDMKGDQKSNYEEATKPDEKILADLWMDILKTDQISVNDNFFDVGGHSLKAIQLASRIFKQIGVEISIKDIFINPCIRQQCELINTHKQTPFKNIVPVPENTYYETSHAQKRLWIIDQIEGGKSIAFNQPRLLIVKNNLNVQLFERALNTLINRHEILRTIFIQVGDKVMQKILPHKTLSIDLMIWENEENLREQLSNEMIYPFSLSNGPLIKVKLAQLDPSTYLIFLLTHHIICDGWSMNIMVRELLHLYHEYMNGVNDSLKPLKIQYKDYAAWQNQELKGEKLKTHRDYWINQLSGITPLNLPIDKKRPLRRTMNGSVLTFNLSEPLSGELKEFCRKEEVTLFILFLAAVKVLFYRYTGQKDISIGTTVAGRDHIDIEEQVGFYVNTLVLRTNFEEAITFKEVLKNVKDSVLEGLQHQIYPFDVLAEELNLEYDISRPPLFNVLVEFDNDETELALSGLNTENYQCDLYFSQYDIRFNFKDTGNVITGVIEYSTDIYDRWRMEQMSHHLELLLEEVKTQPIINLNEIKFIDKKEEDCLLKQFNDSFILPDEKITIIDLLEQQVEKTPHNIALVFGEKTLTYEELNEKSNQLAHYLTGTFSIQPDDLIGIQQSRSEHMVICVLGVLKAGAAYLPIDPEYPNERLNYILSEAKVKLLIADSGQMIKVPEDHLDKLFIIDIQYDELKEYSRENPKRRNGAEDLGYVLYTSGSTGNPKGVAVQLNSITNYLIWANKYYFNNQNGYHSCLFTSLSFDFTVTSLFSTLLRGDKLFIYGDIDINIALQDMLCKENDISTIKLTPAHISILNHLSLKSSSVKHIIVGGEALTIENINTLYKLNKTVKIYNEYGPTEATVGCIVKEIHPADEKVLIGKPIANTNIFILDSFNNLQPIGVDGEICISGVSLARGYINQPALTKNKFSLNPYLNGRLYKTGDVGRWLPDGNIEFKGRVDNQVKIRGNRIELGEIESALKQLLFIKDAVVRSYENKSNEKELVAYLVTEIDVDLQELRTFLQSKLPVYMIPAAYIRLNELPLNARGKIDIKALPQPLNNTIERKTEFIAPRNELEKKLVAIWEEVLGKENIGVKDDFFSLGGHSLKAISLVAKIHEQFNVKLELNLIFSNPELEALSKYIEAISIEDESKITSEELFF